MRTADPGAAETAPHTRSARQNAGVSLGTLWRRTAPPRTADDAAFLTRYESWSRWFIIAAAILPLLVPPKSGKDVSVIVGVGSWLIFLADFIVQSRTRIKYLNSRSGLFDFVIVVLTSPWYLLPGVNGGGLIVILRLARLLRIILVARGARRLIERLGRAALVAAVVVLLCSFVAYRVEQPVNPEFATYGDAVWWGYVTLTTVGYGDVVPITLEGRLAGVAIMTVGIGLLGVLAGSLSSFFKLSPSQDAKDDRDAKKEQGKRGLGDPYHRDDDSDPIVEAGSHGTVVDDPSDAVAIKELSAQIVELREHIKDLNEHVRSQPPPDHSRS